MKINQGLKHYTVNELAEGVFAAIHKYGGQAYSNSGIIDLGDETVVIDTGNSEIAGIELRQIAKLLTGREADKIVLTHVHSDHWSGNQAFPPETKILTTEKLERLMPLRSKRYLELRENPAELHEYLADLEKELEKQAEPIWIEQMLTSITRTKQMIEFVKTYAPRYSDETYSSTCELVGSKRKINLVELGPVHSSNDTMVQLKKDGILFIGDIGFFNLQPYMAMGRFKNWKLEINCLLNSDWEVMVPGHGEVGGKQELMLQLEYFNMLHDKIKEIVFSEGKLKDALQVTLDKKFEPWMRNGLYRFEMNIRYLYSHIKQIKKAEEEKAKSR